MQNVEEKALFLMNLLSVILTKRMVKGKSENIKEIDVDTERTCETLNRQ